VSLARGLASIEVQKAAYSRLKHELADVSIYDAVPEDERFPYVVLGDESSNDWSDKIGAGLDLSMTIQVFSRADGYREAKEIADRVVQALTIAPLAVEGFTVLDIRLEGHEAFRDQEDRRIAIRFGMRLQER